MEKIDAKPEPYRQSVDEALAALGADARLGLSEAEARARLQSYRRNELTAGKLLAQFRDVLVILLLVATLISAALWLYERESTLPYGAIAILAVVLLNAVMGCIQQSRAEQAVAALRQMSAAQANVIRGGKRQSLPAIELERALAVGDRANNAVSQERDGRWTVQGDPMRVRTRKAPSPGFAAIRGYGWKLDYRSCFMWR